MNSVAAVIVDDRRFDNFGKVCFSHIKHFSIGVDLVVYTLPELFDEYERQLNEHGITAKFCDYNNNIKIPHYFYTIEDFDQFIDDHKHLNPILQYSLFFTSIDFWKSLNRYERVVTFQMDSGILKSGIEEFFKWDYIGAPCYNFYNDKTIQNGGLSIRNPKIMEYICRFYSWADDLEDMLNIGRYSSGSFFAEDIFFCLRMIKHSIGNYAPTEEAMKFCMESKLQFGTIGYHNIDSYFSKNITDTIKKQREL